MVEQLHDNDDLDGLLYWPLDEVRTDVACPQCDQNLRGLRGRVVSCPECGHRCDIAALIGVRWNYSWRHTPLVPLVLSPASLALGSAILIGLYVAVTHFLYLPAVGWDWAAMGAGVLWIVAMLRVRIVFGDGQGWTLAAVGHVMLLLITLSVVAVVGLIGVLLVTLQGPEPWMNWVMWATLPGLVFAALPWWLILRWNRWIKLTCLDRHLRKAAMRISKT